MESVSNTTATPETESLNQAPQNKGNVQSSKVQPSRQPRKIQSADEFRNQHQPHTPDQDLTHFGTWVGSPIWVPPKDNNEELAKSMLNRFGPFASKAECWRTVSRQHRSKFTQVREFELPKSSIRLPKGRLFVTVTEQENFDTIEDTIPQCVQTRLDEFLAGPGKKRGVKVYYLKPLCVEVGNELKFTTRTEIDQSIEKIENEVFALYRWRYVPDRARRLAIGFVDSLIGIPRSILRSFVDKKKREIEAYHAQLEFERRKRAMRAVRHRQKYRKDGQCSFEEVLSLTETPDRRDVIDYYVKDNTFASVDRQLFLMASAATLPWFAAMSLAVYQLAAVSVTTTVSVSVCDPAFVAEMPGANGRLLKIGHFDEIDGVMHVEI